MLIYIILALTFSLFLFLSPVKIHVKIIKTEEGKDAELIINYLSIINIHLQIPKMVLQIKNFTPYLSFNVKLTRPLKKAKKDVIPLRYPNIERFKYFINSLTQYVGKFNQISTWMLKLIKIINFELYLSFGRDNPEIISMLTGAAWSVVHILMSKMSYMTDFSKANVKINIIPDFISNEPLKLRIEGIFQIRLGHIIIVSLLLPLLWIYSRKGYNKKIKGAANYG